jgi:hypothetical protein|tara:strand:+ start:1594 stop:2430 length:837 start_codon:yes stop_codon:yes gene_type:complete
MNEEISEKLLKVQSILDGNSSKFKDGEYLEVCNLLRDVFKSKTQSSNLITPNTTRDFSGVLRTRITENRLANFGIPREAVIRHFQNDYIYKFLVIKGENIESEYYRLEQLIDKIKFLNRRSPWVKNQTVKHWAAMNKVHLPDYTPKELRNYLASNGLTIGEPEQSFEYAFKNLCNIFMEVENLHREAYKDRLMQRMDELDDAEEGNSAEIHGIAMLGHPAEEWMNDTTSGEFSPRELSDDEEEFLDEVATNIVRDFLDEAGVDRPEMERDMYSFLMQR